MKTTKSSLLKCIEKANTVVESQRFDNREIWEWAESNIILGSAYGLPGKYHADVSPWLKEPLAALKDYRTRIVTVYKIPQGGGTLLADLAIPWFVSQRSVPIGFYFSSQPLARKHMEMRLSQVLKDCKALQPLLPRLNNGEVAGRAFTQEGVKFSNTYLYIDGATQQSLNAKSFGFVICDEVHAFQFPIELALVRRDAFIASGMDKVLLISQPGDGGDQMDLAFLEGTMEEWMVPCLECNKHQKPIWSQMKWTKSESGVVSDIHYACQYCGHKHYDTPQLKRIWRERGQYVQTNPSGTIEKRSFRWNAIHMRVWKDLVDEWLIASEQSKLGFKDKLIEFIRQRLCEPDNAGLGEEKNRLFFGDYDVGSSWDKEVIRVMTVDVQNESNHFWTEIRAWAENGESRQLHFSRVESEAGLVDLQNTFKVHPQFVFCDVAHDTTRACEMMLRHNWRGLWGYGKSDYFTWEDPKTKKRFSRVFSPKKHKEVSKGKFADYCHWGVRPVHDILNALRSGRGVPFLSLNNEDYKKQLFSKYRDTFRDPDTGKVQVTYKQRKGFPEGHAFDLSSMQIVVCIMSGRIKIAQDRVPSPTDRVEDVDKTYKEDTTIETT